MSAKWSCLLVCWYFNIYLLLVVIAVRITISITDFPCLWIGLYWWLYSDFGLFTDSRINVYSGVIVVSLSQVCVLLVLNRQLNITVDSSLMIVGMFYNIYHGNNLCHPRNYRISVISLFYVICVFEMEILHQLWHISHFYRVICIT